MIDVADQLEHPHERITLVTGDAAGEATTARAATTAEAAGPLSGSVNNAAVFRDADLATAPVEDVLAPSPPASPSPSTAAQARSATSRAQ